jgi:hypothetical protein
MGLLDLFGRGPMSDAKIAKVAKLAANPFAQPDVRMKEMQRLLDDGSDNALRGVLKRFTANAQGHIADEDEKKWLTDQLVEVGERALGPIGEYVAVEENLTYVLRAYERIAGPERAVAFLISALEKYGPENYRAGEQKLQLVLALGEHLADARVLPALCPFLGDHSDDVRWAVMDVLERAAATDPLPADVIEAAATRLGELVALDDASPRIQRRAATLLADREWVVPGTSETFSPTLSDEFFLDKKRYVRRRAKRPEAK